jgi:hypothetical protein
LEYTTFPITSGGIALGFTAQPLAFRWATSQTGAQNVVFLRGRIG